MRSKSEGIRAIIERETKDALNEIIANSMVNKPEAAKLLHSLRSDVVHAVAYRFYDYYTVAELNDVMHWKKPREI